MKDTSNRRINELVASFFAHWEKGQSACEAMRAAPSFPCSRFWISEEAAMKNIRKVRRGGILAIRTRRVREMTRLIMERCNGTFTGRMVEQAINTPAPQFFIEPETARRLIQKELKRRRKCRKR